MGSIIQLNSQAARGKHILQKNTFFQGIIPSSERHKSMVILVSWGDLQGFVTQGKLGGGIIVSNCARTAVDKANSFGMEKASLEGLAELSVKFIGGLLGVVTGLGSGSPKSGE